MYHVWGRGEVYTGLWWGNVRPLGRPRHRWEDNINMDLQEVEWGNGLDEPSVSINCGQFLD